MQVTHPGGQEVPRQSLHLKGRGYVCRNHTFISPPMQKSSLNVSQKELFTVLCCICTPYLFSVRHCEIVLADRLYCKKLLWFVFASILQSDHYGKPMHRIITAIGHCQHSHSVIHSFRSAAKQKTLCCLIFAEQCVQYFRRFTDRMLVLPQCAQIKPTV